jgi:hypothetical protein
LAFAEATSMAWAVFYSFVIAATKLSPRLRNQPPRRAGFTLSRTSTKRHGSIT